ncbi:15323_t:CDS:2 [Rhizophagus irregularis]|nr:15323_t:CDS:2 [Rhizophagus irregularis]
MSKLRKRPKLLLRGNEFMSLIESSAPEKVISDTNKSTKDTESSVSK